MISIIIPTYNERENIEKLIPMIDDALRGYNYEIIVVDDNSPDGTWMVAKQLSDKYPVKLLLRESKKGLATAVIDGIKKAEGEIVVVMDADLQHPPRYIPSLVEPILSENYDVVIGSRYIEGGSIKEWGIIRKIVSKAANLLSHVAVLKLRGIKDTMSGFFAFKKSVVEGVELNPLGYKILLEILVKGKVERVKEVPYTFEKRYAGESKLGSKEIFNYVKHLIRLSLWTGDIWRIFRYAIVGASGIAINLIVLYSLVDMGFMEGLLALLGLSIPSSLIFIESVTRDTIIKVLSAAISVEVSIIWNFILNNAWTFKDRGKRGREALSAMMKFNIVSFGGLLINLATYTLLLTFLGLNYLLAEIIAVFVAFIWNFFINDSWTWQYRRKLI